MFCIGKNILKDVIDFYNFLNIEKNRGYFPIHMGGGRVMSIIHFWYK